MMLWIQARPGLTQGQQENELPQMIHAGFGLGDSEAMGDPCG